ncbi:MAG: tetraacyldisaccharide 4'-kinase [Candidatus Cloacimonetes bacterium]|nr:tetraacyldisaccharide 4'-kinase [Candidatus Cloacimonadota bacterium]
MDKHSFARNHLLTRSLLSYLLYPTSCIYAGFMLFRRRYLYRKPYRAPFKVISIGNIVSGGSGKTPITIALANALQALGLKVAIASRGYLAGWEDRGGQISDGTKLLTNVANAGDEAMMVASSLPGIPVFVGRKRSAILELISKSISPDIVILDDALQHLKVARDLDLIVFDSLVGLGNGFVIPAGYLREPLSSLPENAIILLHSKNGHTPKQELMHCLKNLQLPLFMVNSQASRILRDNAEITPSSLMGKSISLVSAIAHPDSFEDSVNSLGITYHKHHRFPDHFAYQDDAAMTNLLNDVSEYLLCTAKDYTKLQSVPTLKDRLLCLNLETTLDSALVDKVMELIEN